MTMTLKKYHWATLLAFALACLFIHQNAHARRYQVDTHFDAPLRNPDHCSLRRAIMSVNSQRDLGTCVNLDAEDVESNTIELLNNAVHNLSIPRSLGVAHNIDFEGSLYIGRDLNLIGHGPESTSISALGLLSNALREPVTGSFYADRVLKIGPGVEVRIEGIAIANGHYYKGSGIYNQGSLTLINSKVHLNSTGTEYAYDIAIGQDLDGGGIYSLGPLTLINSIVEDNITEGFGGRSAGYGAGIFVYFPSSSNDFYQEGEFQVRIENSIIRNNRSNNPGQAPTFGGGLYIRGGHSLHIIDSIIESNRSEYHGGISIIDTDISVIENSYITQNSSRQDNAGVNALYYEDNKSLKINKSAITENHVEEVIGFYGSGAVKIMKDLDFFSGGPVVPQNIKAQIINSTISSNTIADNISSRTAAGIVSTADLEIINSTLAMNFIINDRSGRDDDDVKHGIYMRGDIQNGEILEHNRLFIKNSLLQEVNACFLDIGVEVISGGYNIGSSDDCQLNGVGDILANAFLGPLQVNDNRGILPTHALTERSPAIAYSQDCTDFEGNPIREDQRSWGRSRAPFNCSSGAYEPQSKKKPIADLNLELFRSTQNLNIGQNTITGIKVQNSGPQAALNTKLYIDFPLGIEIDEVAASQGLCKRIQPRHNEVDEEELILHEQTYFCQLNTVGPHAEQFVNLGLSYSFVESGTKTIRFRVSTSSDDPNLENNNLRLKHKITRNKKSPAKALR